MSNLNKQFKEEFNYLDVSQKTSEKIKDNIICKYRTREKNKKILLTLVTISIITLVGLGVTYAEDIKDSFNSLRTRIVRKKYKEEEYKVRYINSNAIAKINYDADLPERDVLTAYDKIDGNYQTYSFSELETLLNIKVLRSPLYKKERLMHNYTYKVDGKIASSSFLMENIYNELPDDKSNYRRDFVKCDMTISFKTKYFDKDDRSFGFGNTLVHETSEYYIKKLDTKALIVKYKDLNLVNAIFEYDNIRYTFEMFTTLNLDPLEEMYKILDSLSY